jgi:hypothetical protein
MKRVLWWFCGFVLVGLLSVTCLVSMAQSDPPATLAIELNKLEPIQGGCRLYFLFQNRTPFSYSSLEFDLVLFAKNGVIATRTAVETAPLTAHKSHVKLFDLPDLDCTHIGRILLNEVSTCAINTSKQIDCLSLMTLSSRTEVEFLM